MEVRPRYALWKYDDEALPEDDLDLEDDLELMDTLSKKMGIEDIVRGMSLKEFVDTGRAFLLNNGMGLV